MKALPAPLAAALILTAGFTAFPMQARASTARLASSPRTCAAASLTIHPTGMGGGAGGNTEVVYRIHNLTAHACRLSGYPRVRLLTASRAPLPTILHFGHSYLVDDPPHTVTLPPRGFGRFWVAYVDLPTSAHPNCPYVPYLRILLPGTHRAIVTHSQIASMRARGPFRPCGPDITVSSFHLG
jgi:hypothetical protein